MIRFLNVFVCSPSKRSPKTLFGTAIRKIITNQVRNLQILRAPVHSLLLNGNASNIQVNIFSRNVIRYFMDAKKKTPTQEGSKSKKDINLWTSVLLVLGVGAAVTIYMLNIKHQKMELLEKERKRAIGKIKIGGKFELVDHNNEVKKSEDFLGKWLLIYFGFTHCPDICPDEMEKLVQVVDELDADKTVASIQPIFITVDPVRDTVSVVKKYVKEFSDKIIGLTGTVEQIANVCKAYRVYFSAGPKDKDSDYIVDHSIIMYLVDPNGDFIDYFGQTANAKQIANGIKINMAKFDCLNKKGLWSRVTG